jgi:hypothetical protein
MATDRNLNWKGLWIPVVCYLIFVVAILPESPYRSWVQNVLGVPHDSDSAKAYLAKRVANGVSAGSGLLLILLLAAFTWRRWWYWTFMGVFPALMFLAYPIAYAVALLWRCLSLIDPAKAESLLGDNGLQDRTFWFGFRSALAFSMVWIVVAVTQRLRSRQPAGPGDATADGSPS